MDETESWGEESLCQHGKKKVSIYLSQEERKGPMREHGSVEALSVSVFVLAW